MKKLIQLLPLLAALFFFSCKKQVIAEEEKPVFNETMTKRINIRNPGYTEYPLTNNNDGTYSVSIMDNILTFSNIMYEMNYDANGNLVTPKDGDPFWANMVTDDYYTSEITVYPNQPPNNQFVIKMSSFTGSIGLDLTKMNQYFTDLDAKWTTYQSALSTQSSIVQLYALVFYYTGWAQITTGPGYASVSSTITLNNPQFAPPDISKYIQVAHVQATGNRLVTGALIRKADGSLAIRLADIALS
jgi:hypothetical protein